MGSWPWTEGRPARPQHWQHPFNAHWWRGASWPSANGDHRCFADTETRFPADMHSLLQQRSSSHAGAGFSGRSRRAGPVHSHRLRVVQTHSSLYNFSTSRADEEKLPARRNRAMVRRQGDWPRQLAPLSAARGHQTLERDTLTAQSHSDARHAPCAARQLQETVWGLLDMNPKQLKGVEHLLPEGLTADLAIAVKLPRNNQVRQATELHWWLLGAVPGRLRGLSLLMAGHGRNGMGWHGMARTVRTASHAGRGLRHTNTVNCEHGAPPRAVTTTTLLCACTHAHTQVLHCAAHFQGRKRQGGKGRTAIMASPVAR